MRRHLSLAVIGLVGFAGWGFADDVERGLKHQMVQKSPSNRTSAGPKTSASTLVKVAEPLPADAQALINVFDGEAEAIRQKAEQEIQVRRVSLIASLQALQDVYTREAKLDEAVAIRDTIRQLRVAQLKPLPDPGNLSDYAARIGEALYFEIVGQVGHSVWGTEVYTCDSHLATAAVHAGILKKGQRGIVKVTIVKSPESHLGATQNGVTSANWGYYGSSYTVESAVLQRPAH